MAYFRAYEYTCFCGRHVEGQYQIDEATFQRPAPNPVDPDRAICNQARGKAAGQPRSVTETHYVGCGRTLRKSEQDRLDAEAMKRQASAQRVSA